MNKTLWIMVGAPGSGKSWIAENVLIKDSKWGYISRDKVRYSMITDEDEYFEKEDLVFKRFIEEIKSSFNNNDNVIADATHLNWASRRKLLHALGQDTHPTWDIIPVMITVPLNEAIQNNKQRSGRSQLPVSALKKMFFRLTDPKNDPYQYTKIVYIDNTRKRKEKLE